MIAITCNLQTDQLNGGSRMYIDHHQLFRPITKATLPLREGCVAATVAEAVKIAMSEPRGPVHLDLPEDVALATATETIPEIPSFAPIASASSESVNAGLEVMAMAGAPDSFVWIKQYADERSRAFLLSFIEHHGLPFCTTTMAKGMIDEDHPSIHRVH